MACKAKGSIQRWKCLWQKAAAELSVQCHFLEGAKKKWQDTVGGRKCQLKGGIDEILQRAICQVQPNLRSHSSDSQNSFIVWLAIKCFCIQGNAVAKMLTIHIKMAKKEQNMFCPQKSLPCRGSLLGVCWRSLPGGGFLVSRSWTFSGPNVIYLYPDCRFKIGFLKMDLCQTLLSQKDSSGWNFSKLWCGTSQALWGPRLRRVGSGLGEFFLGQKANRVLVSSKVFFT